MVLLTVRMRTVESRKSVNDRARVRTVKYNINVIYRAHTRLVKLRICVIDRAHVHGRLTQEGWWACKCAQPTKRQVLFPVRVHGGMIVNLSMTGFLISL